MGLQDVRLQMLFCKGRRESFERPTVERDVTQDQRMGSCVFGSPVAARTAAGGIDP